MKGLPERAFQSCPLCSEPVLALPTVGNPRAEFDEEPVLGGAWQWDQQRGLAVRGAFSLKRASALGLKPHYCAQAEIQLKQQSAREASSHAEKGRH